MDATNNIISLVGEDIGYDDFIALKNISLSIRAGERIALIGKSGMGKTTLLKKIYQCMPNECGFIHQQHALVGQLKVIHNIYMGRLDDHPTWKNIATLIRPSQHVIAEITPIAKQLGIEKLLFATTGELSGGQQQRVGIARALYRGRKVILADEPVSSLDAVQSKEVLDLVLNAGDTVIASLHSVPLSLQYFERIIGLKDGQIFFDLPAQDVQESQLAALYR